MDRVNALQQEIQQYQQHQQQVCIDIQKVLSESCQGASQQPAGSVPTAELQSQIQVLGVLSHARTYVERLKHVAELVKQLERQIRAAHSQSAAQLVELAPSVADGYSVCMGDLEQLSSCAYPDQAVPQQLRALEERLQLQLEAVQVSLRRALGQHIHQCLGQCGWPPPIPGAQSGALHGDGQIFGTGHADAINMLQYLMKALTRLQLAAQKATITAVLQYESTASSSSSIAGPEPPLLWMAEELVDPLKQELCRVFGPSTPGSPGDLKTPELLLGVVHQLALQNAQRVDFLQGVLQGLEVHSVYQIGVEFTRALCDVVKLLLRQYKLPEVAAAGSHELWLQWLDALIDFEAKLGVHGLLGVQWDSKAHPEHLPATLLRGSTLTVLGEDQMWRDAWLQAEADWAIKRVEAVLYSPEGWQPGQLLVAEDGPAWQADVWPPHAAEKVVNLVEGMLQTRLCFIPDPVVQQQYLQRAVAEVLSRAHGIISRMLQQADLFRNITGKDWLYKVCPCICFCHFVEQQLQDMHDDAEVYVGHILEEQQQQQANGSAPQSLQGAQQMEQQLHPGQHAAANGDSSHGIYSNGNTHQQQHRLSETAAFEAAVAAANTKMRTLARPIQEFSSCRREWVLKLGKAVVLGFMQKAAGYVSHGTYFKATEGAPALTADGVPGSSSGVVSGELQAALAWLAQLLENLSQHLDKECFRQAWGAAAAAINRELFNNVACEAYFNKAGALQLFVDYQALLSVFSRYTQHPASYFKELGDAIKLLMLPDMQADAVRQAVSAATRALNAADLLKSVGVHHLDADLADTVMSLRDF